MGFDFGVLKQKSAKCRNDMKSWVARHFKEVVHPVSVLSFSTNLPITNQEKVGVLIEKWIFIYERVLMRNCLWLVFCNGLLLSFWWLILLPFIFCQFIPLIESKSWHLKKSTNWLHCPYIFYTFTQIKHNFVTPSSQNSGPFL